MKLLALKKLRSYLSAHMDSFSVSDYVEGGFQNLPPQERSMVDYNFLRSVAREYYMAVIHKLVYSLDAAVNYYFIHFVCSDDNNELRFDLLDIVDKISDDDLKVLGDDDFETINEKLEKKERKFEKMKRILPQSRRLFQDLKQSYKNINQDRFTIVLQPEAPTTTNQLPVFNSNTNVTYNTFVNVSNSQTTELNNSQITQSQSQVNNVSGNQDNQQTNVQSPQDNQQTNVQSPQDNQQTNVQSPQDNQQFYY